VAMSSPRWAKSALRMDGTMRTLMASRTREGKPSYRA
jgi:hypothetical protein